MNTFITIYTIITTALTIFAAYRGLYFVIGLFSKKKTYKETNNYHKFGIIVSARNEERVIGNLVKSLKQQNYPQDKISVFVIADNCTDNTAQVARDAGAIVYERFNNKNIGKGYALSWFQKILFSEYIDENGNSLFDAFMVFDADNLVSPNYVREMNKVFDEGYKVCRGYFNTKNFTDNWLSASYGIHFYRSNMALHRARNRLNISTTINGPGYYFASELVKDGWPTSTITEDIDLSFSFVEKGIQIAFCEDAEFYDEEPTKVRQMLRQKLRWAKGYLQNFKKHFCKLFKAMFTFKDKKGKQKFSHIASAYDMCVQVFPLSLVNSVLLCIYRFMIILGVLLNIVNNTILALVLSWVVSIITSWLSNALLALLVMIREHKHIKVKFWQAIWFAIMFPTYDRVWKYSLGFALFKKVEWKPIEHKVSLDISDVTKK